MKSVLRALAAVVGGLIASFILVVAMELFSGVVHPFPEGFGETPEEICLHVERCPQWVLAVAVAAWAVAAFVGTWIAQRIGNIYSAVIVGVLLLAGLVLNLSMLPYPIWFKVANLVAIPTALAAGSRSAMRPKTVGAAVAN